MCNACGYPARQGHWTDAGLDTPHDRLRARFRQTYGLSLGQYLRNLRLQDAVAMMRHSQENLTDIALSCGFSSSATFLSGVRTAWSSASATSTEPCVRSEVNLTSLSDDGVTFLAAASPSPAGTASPC